MFKITKLIIDLIIINKLINDVNIFFKKTIPSKQKILSPIERFSTTWNEY